LLLVEAARIAAGRRSEEQATALNELADAVANAGEDSSALLADWAFMAALVEAAGNLVFQLIMNSVRALYLPRAQAFAGIVARRDELVPLYRRTAAAVGARDAQVAVEAIAELASVQAACMLR